ncbi:hypothetical protein KAI54_02660 [Candidatus Gracilibacteria bacterium]|nr:hypothetical protein [Candidatus Gracilibacteria bacterium]
MNFKKLFVAIAFVVLLTGCNNLSEVEAKNLAENFINEYLLSGGPSAKVIETKSESGFWKLKIQLPDEREVDSFLSKDGKIFVPEAIYIEEVQAEVEKQKLEAEEMQAEILASMEKNERPVVELFVMSHCPFGTQAEKAILPAIEALGDSVDFQLKFVNYVMHGETEVREQLQQFAISEKYPEKLLPYLKKFLEVGDSAAALAAVDLKVGDLADTIATTDAKFEITKNLEDKSLWVKNQRGEPAYPHFNIHDSENEKYIVGGSPVFVVNGKVVEGAVRTPAAMLEMICGAFENSIEACSLELSSTTPSSGFGFDGEGSDGGSCS